jgi:hypothetical protein
LDDTELRELDRVRVKHAQELTDHKNRVQKLLSRAGYNLSQVVSDVFGKSGQLIVGELMAGSEPAEIIAALVKSDWGYRLRAPKETLMDALWGAMSSVLRFELGEEYETIHFNQTKIAALVEVMEDVVINQGREYQLDPLETIPGVSRTSAMTLLVELVPTSRGTSGRPRPWPVWSECAPATTYPPARGKAARRRAATAI